MLLYPFLRPDESESKKLYYRGEYTNTPSDTLAMRFCQAYLLFPPPQLWKLKPRGL